LFVARKDAGQAHHVGDVTPYANSLFYFVAHNLHNSLFLDSYLKQRELCLLCLDTLHRLVVILFV
jgi:hypothetical protein